MCCECAVNDVSTVLAWAPDVLTALDAGPDLLSNRADGDEGAENCIDSSAAECAASACTRLGSCATNASCLLLSVPPERRSVSSCSASRSCE